MNLLTKLHGLTFSKKLHIANSDTDSEKSYPAPQPTRSSSSSSTNTPFVPRFLLIHSDQEESISSCLRSLYIK